MNDNDILQPHERLILGIDTARAPDACCEVTAIYDTFTGKLRIIDVQTLGVWVVSSWRTRDKNKRSLKAFERELPARIREQRARLLAKGGYAHPEVPNDPRPKRPGGT